MAAGNAGWIAGSPGSAVVFAKVPCNGPLWIIDLAHDTLIQQPVHGEVSMIAATPDGRYLLCSDSQCLHRLAIDGTKLGMTRRALRSLATIPSGLKSATTRSTWPWSVATATSLPRAMPQFPMRPTFMRPAN